MNSALLYSLAAYTLFTAVNTEYKVARGQHDFVSAVDICSRLGKEWQVPDELSNASELKLVMTRNNISSVWFSIIRVTYKGWQWVDGTPDYTFRVNNTGDACSKLSRLGKILVSACFSQEIGYVCTRKADGRWCPPDHSCFKINQTNYFMRCAILDWYKARSICIKYEGDLAVLNEKWRASYVALRMKMIPCDESFVGLHRETWTAVDSSHGCRVPIESDWDTDEPSRSPHKRCVELTSNGKWKAQSCLEMNSVTCYMYQGDGGSSVNQDLLRQLKLSEHKTTYANFRQSCLRPADNRLAKMNDAIQEALVKNNIPSIWLPIRKRDLGGWHWLDGTRFQGYFESFAGLEDDCAVLSLSLGMIAQVPCTSRIPCFICELMESHPQVHCTVFRAMKIYNRKYVIIQKRMTWYEAKESCSKSGNRLATFPNEANVPHDVKLQLQTINDFWIGLRRKEYFYDTPYNNNKNEDVSFYNWSPTVSNNKHYDGECAVVNRKSDGDISWMQENCNALHHYACTKHRLNNDKGALTDAPETYTVASTSCQRQGGVLPSYRDEDLFSQIENDLNKMNKSQVRLWTSVTVEHLPGFIWLNGDKADVKQTSLYECGHLDTTTRNLSTSDCSIGRHGLICQFMTNAGVTCDSRCETINRVSCISIYDTCYVAWCPQQGKEKTWLASEKECRTQGGHLAQLMLPNTRKLLSDQLRDQQDSECREYSIGFRNFKITDNLSGEDIPPEKLKWNKSWSHDSPQCMTVTIEGKQKPLWTPTSCSKAHNFRCKITVSYKGEEDGMSLGNIAAIAGGAVGGVVLIVIIIVAMVYICRKRRDKRTDRTPVVPRETEMTKVTPEQRMSEQKENLLSRKPRNQRPEGPVSHLTEAFEKLEADKDKVPDKRPEPLTGLVYGDACNNRNGNDSKGPLHLFE